MIWFSSKAFRCACTLILTHMPLWKYDSLRHWLTSFCPALFFRLAYFEVKYQFYRREKLMWAVIRHYTEQVGDLNTLIQCQRLLHEHTLSNTLHHCIWKSFSLLIVLDADVRVGFGSGCSWKSIWLDPRLIRRSGGFLLWAHPGLTNAVHLYVHSGLII
jgi:hypothetical protein